MIGKARRPSVRNSANADRIMGWCASEAPAMSERGFYTHAVVPRMCDKNCLKERRIVVALAATSLSPRPQRTTMADFLHGGGAMAHRTGDRERLWWPHEPDDADQRPRLQAPLHLPRDGGGPAAQPVPRRPDRRGGPALPAQAAGRVRRRRLPAATRCGGRGCAGPERAGCTCWCCWSSSRAATARWRCGCWSTRRCCTGSCCAPAKARGVPARCRRCCRWCCTTASRAGARRGTCRGWSRRWGRGWRRTSPGSATRCCGGSPTFKTATGHAAMWPTLAACAGVFIPKDLCGRLWL